MKSTLAICALCAALSVPLMAQDGRSYRHENDGNRGGARIERRHDGDSRRPDARRGDERHRGQNQQWRDGRHDGYRDHRGRGDYNGQWRRQDHGSQWRHHQHDQWRRSSPSFRFEYRSYPYYYERHSYRYPYPYYNYQYNYYNSSPSYRYTPGTTYYYDGGTYYTNPGSSVIYTQPSRVYTAPAVGYDTANQPVVVERRAVSAPAGTDGWSLLEQGDSSAALTQFTRVLVDDPQSASAKVGFAIASASNGSLSQAVWAMRSAVASDAGILNAAPMGQGTRQRVSAAIVRFVYPEPGESISKADASFMAAALHVMLGNTQAAQESIDRAVAAGDTSLSTQTLRGLLGR